MGVVDPDGPPDAERHRLRDLPVALHQRQTAGDHPAQLAVAERGALEERTDPMCMWLTASSTSRKDASSALRRFIRGRAEQVRRGCRPANPREHRLPPELADGVADLLHHHVEVGHIVAVRDDAEEGIAVVADYRHADGVRGRERDQGLDPRIRHPNAYSGCCGPGTFVIVTLKRRVA